MDAEAQRVHGNEKGDLEGVDWAPSPPSLVHVKDDRGEKDLGEEEQSTGMTSETDVEPETSGDFGGWDSSDDVGNPQNWSVRKKVFHTAIPALYGFVVTVATSVYVPAIPLIMSRFHVSREVAILPLSLYTFGFTVGPVLSAPLSELYGRRIVYWTTMILLAICTLIASLAPNITVLTIFRFLAGVGGSGSLAIGAGTIADMWSIETRGLAALCFVLSPFLGPALGPLTGAYVIDEYDNDWRWTMYVIMIIAAPIAIMSLFMSETSASRILYLRGKKLATATKHSKPRHQAGDTAILLRKLRTAIGRPLSMMIREPLVAYLSIYTGFAFAMMFSFFGSYSYVFQTIYHFDQKQVGLTFLGILVGFLFAVTTFGIFDATLYRRAVAESRGRPAPEHRLYAAMLGSFMLPIGLFWFAWSPMKDVHWIVPVLAGIPFGWGCLSIFISATTYLVDVYLAANSASAVAANGILRYGLGAAFPLFTLQMYESLGVHWAGSIFAFVAVLGMPVPWIFFKYGKALRARSRYETSKN